jgi:hypothetical protein
MPKYLQFLNEGKDFNLIKEKIDEAVSRYKREEKKGSDWTYMWLTNVLRDDFDKYLLSIKHPLNMQPGTNEHRWHMYIKELATK